MKNNQQEFYPVALTIAGSDSGGGAGIQADLRTFNAFGVFGTTAITAITSQNPAAVTRVDLLDPAAVTAQLSAIFAKLAVSAAKCGMLGNSAIILAVADFLKKHRQLHLVVDPVMVSTSGAKLLDDDAVSVMKQELLPLADIITPNIPEAELLTGRKLATFDDFVQAAIEMAEQYRAMIILKGGHSIEDKEYAVDIAVRDGKIYELISPRVDIAEYTDHGTGCTFSAALTAAHAIGLGWKETLTAAKGFVLGSLAEAVEIGPKLQAMYPPLESYETKTDLQQLKIPGTGK